MHSRFLRDAEAADPQIRRIWSVGRKEAFNGVIDVNFKAGFPARQVLTGMTVQCAAGLGAPSRESVGLVPFGTAGNLADFPAYSTRLHVSAGDAFNGDHWSEGLLFAHGHLQRLQFPLRNPDSDLQHLRFGTTFIYSNAIVSFRGERQGEGATVALPLPAPPPPPPSTPLGIAGERYRWHYPWSTEVVAVEWKPGPFGFTVWRAPEPILRSLGSRSPAQLVRLNNAANAARRRQ